MLVINYLRTGRQLFSGLVRDSYGGFNKPWKHYGDDIERRVKERESVRIEVRNCTAEGPITLE